MFAYDSQVHIPLKFKRTVLNIKFCLVKKITYPRSALLISANNCVLPGFQRLYLKVTEQGGRRWTRCPGFKICTDLLALINCHCQLWRLDPNTLLMATSMLQISSYNILLPGRLSSKLQKFQEETNEDSMFKSNHNESRNCPNMNHKPWHPFRVQGFPD